MFFVVLGGTELGRLVSFPYPMSPVARKGHQSHPRGSAEPELIRARTFTHYIPDTEEDGSISIRNCDNILCKSVHRPQQFCTSNEQLIGSNVDKIRYVLLIMLHVSIVNDHHQAQWVHWYWLCHVQVLT
jgi:hypothetical protein